MGQKKLKLNLTKLPICRLTSAVLIGIWEWIHLIIFLVIIFPLFVYWDD